MKKKYCIITNKKPAIELYVAGSFLERLRGLLGTKTLEAYTGLLLADCNAVHMFFMRYALDIVYVDADFRIVKIVEDLHPWQISGCCKAKHTIELPAGTVKGLAWTLHSYLELSKNDIV
jgi:uncharacterized protein